MWYISGPENTKWGAARKKGKEKRKKRKKGVDNGVGGVVI